MQEKTRRIQTARGSITYTLIYKNVKNMNLRLDGAGRVVLSVPRACPEMLADDWIASKSGWIFGRLERMQALKSVRLLPELDRERCALIFAQAVDRMLPLVEPYGVSRPEVKLRRMKSQWGNCHWNQGYITLNIALHRCPLYLLDYVVLHELVHFIHHDHGSGFYAVMDRLMPDWRVFRRELKGYVMAIQE